MGTSLPTRLGLRGPRLHPGGGELDPRERECNTDATRDSEGEQGRPGSAKRCRDRSEWPERACTQACADRCPCEGSTGDSERASALTADDGHSTFGHDGPRRDGGDDRGRQCNAGHRAAGQLERDGDTGREERREHRDGADRPWDDQARYDGNAPAARARRDLASEGRDTRERDSERRAAHGRRQHGAEDDGRRNTVRARHTCEFGADSPTNADEGERCQQDDESDDCRR